MVNRLANRFLETAGDIRAVLSTLFESAEFWDPIHYQRKFKTPYQYVLSIARAIGQPASSEKRLGQLAGAMKLLGMPLFQCRTPDGYPQVEAAWLSPDTLLQRVSLATKLPRGSQLDPAALRATLGDQFSPETLAVVDSAPISLRSVLILGSPEMMYR